jgi:hypothetical protein
MFSDEIRDGPWIQRIFRAALAFAVGYDEGALFLFKDVYPYLKGKGINWLGLAFCLTRGKRKDLTLLVRSSAYRAVSRYPDSHAGVRIL